MRILRAELHSVRHIQALTIDLDAPLTAITGPNGVGKTTLQQALLAALFYHSKKDTRDAFISRFDPHAPPQAILTLARGGSSTPIVYTRRLTDDAGEWREGALTLKKKGEALKKIQERFPLDPDAAALLLWGRHEDLALVVDQFPSDGHSLLTAATIRGLGPDPKEIVEELAQDFAAAKRTGKNPGALTQAQVRIAELNGELEKAREAERKRTELTLAFDSAKQRREQSGQRRAESDQTVKHLERLEKLLETALQALAQRTALEKQQQLWNGLDAEIERAERQRQTLDDELRLLDIQWRVAKAHEIEQQLLQKQTQLAEVEEAEQRRAALDQALQAVRRPQKTDVETLRRLQTQLKEAADKMEASGLRYRLSVEGADRLVEVVEDHGVARKVRVTSELPHEGVVGQVVFLADGLRLAAYGKEDVASHKRAIERLRQEILAHLLAFGTPDEAAFVSLAAERERINEELREAAADLKAKLKGSTRDQLKRDVSRVEQERVELRVSASDSADWRHRPLEPAAELLRHRQSKEGELKAVVKACTDQRAKQPTDDRKRQLLNDLELGVKNSNRTAEAFQAADDRGSAVSDAALQELRQRLTEERKENGRRRDEQSASERDFERLAAELKHAGAERSLPSIEADLAEAQVLHQREKVLQEARELLKQRLEEKVTEMAAEVPLELGERVSQHLGRLTTGAFTKVSLSPNLCIAGLADEQPIAGAWETKHLSYGERNQAALAVKIAVARALAETHGPIFLILDDSLVSFDPNRRAATEKLLEELTADGRLQIILLTCHTDWIEDWKARAKTALHHIELKKIAAYYADVHTNPPAEVVGE